MLSSHFCHTAVKKELSAIQDKAKEQRAIKPVDPHDHYYGAFPSQETWNKVFNPLYVSEENNSIRRNRKSRLFAWFLSIGGAS